MIPIHLLRDEQFAYNKFCTVVLPVKLLQWKAIGIRRKILQKSYTRREAVLPTQKSIPL